MTHRHIQNHPYVVSRLTEYDKTPEPPDDRDRFIRISIALTGFSEAELRTTRMVDDYFGEVGLIVGLKIREAFLAENIANPVLALQSKLWRPLAQNLIRMWYLGQWKAMPSDWVNGDLVHRLLGYNEFRRDVDHVISPRSYQEGLAWRAMGVNPPGAKQPGFGSWTRDPQ